MDSFSLVSSPFGLVSFESTAVAVDPALSVPAALLEGSVSVAPCGVPGVVVEDEAAGAVEEGAAEEGEVVGEAGGEAVGAAVPPAGATEAGAGAEDAGAGAEDAGAAGAVCGASARLQPARAATARSDTARSGARDAALSGARDPEERSGWIFVMSFSFPMLRSHAVAPPLHTG